MDLMSFVKSPYGLMILFSIFIIVVVPKVGSHTECMMHRHCPVLPCPVTRLTIY